MSRIRTKPSKRNDSVDATLLKLGRRHFSQDFPNPKSLGCPRVEKLKDLAEHPRVAEESVLNHISFCSPCYRAFSRFSQAHRRKLRSNSSRPSITPGETRRSPDAPRPVELVARLGESRLFPSFSCDHVKNATSLDPLL